MAFDKCKAPGTPLTSRLGLIKVWFKLQGSFSSVKSQLLTQYGQHSGSKPSKLARYSAFRIQRVINFAICANSSILQKSGEMLAKPKLAKYLGFATNTGHASLVPANNLSALNT
jgi:hypothetical protein